MINSDIISENWLKNLTEVQKPKLNTDFECAIINMVVDVYKNPSRRFRLAQEGARDPLCEETRTRQMTLQFISWRVMRCNV